MADQNCSTCSAYLAMAARKRGNGLCRAHPPRPTFAGIQTKPVNVLKPGVATQEPVIITLYPSMAPDDWCREWQPKETN